MRRGSHEDPVKPKGYKKPASKLKASRPPMWIRDLSPARAEAITWLRGDRK